MKRFIPVPLVLIAITVVVSAQSTQRGPAAGDWPLYSRNLAGTRYSPLNEINTGNVANLAPAWSMRLTQPAGRRGGGPAPAAEAAPAGRGAGAAGNPRLVRLALDWRSGRPSSVEGRGGGNDGLDASGSNPQATPIVVGGVMYLPARGNQVLAIEAHTGKEMWRYLMPLGMATTARGVAYWPGDGKLAPRILLTAGPRLVALDAATGIPAADFGRNGIVEIAVPWNGVPTIYRNIAILGATTGEVALAEPGDTRAFDIRTGKHLWDFHTVPLPGEARTRHVARSRMAQSIGRQRVGVVHDARRRARHPLHAGRGSCGQLLGRRSPGQQPLRQFDRRGRTPRPANTSGTSRPCITISGTRTCRIRRRSSTSCRTAAAFRRSHRSARPDRCSSSIA